MNIHKKNILLVEDEAIIAMLEKQELEPYGYSVHHVMNGEDAVTSVLDPCSDYDLILMDIDLGSGIDGTQAAEQILQHKDIPVVFLSSHTEPEIVEKTENITSYGYVVKNSGIVVLDTSIKMALKLFETKIEQKQAEEKLIEQKNLLSAIYRNAPLIMMVVNAERRIQQINGFATQFANRDAEQMLGLRGGEALRCVHVLDDPEGCGFGEFCQQCVIRNTMLNSLETGKEYVQVEAPYYFMREDNKTREIYFLMSTSLIEVEGERMVLVTLQDITERKQAEEALRESDEKMRSIYRVAPTGIGVVVNRLLKEVNPRICEMTGYTREELIGKNAQILYPTRGEYEFVGKEKYEQIRKTGTGEVETLWQKKDGTIINVLLASTPIDINDHSRGVTFTALDITERKQAEDASNASRDLLDATQRIARVGGWEWDVERQAMTWADQTYRIHGYEPGEFEVGSPEHIQRSLACYDPDDRPKIESAFRKCVEEGEDYSLEFPLTTSQGGRIWVQTSAQAVLEGGRVVKVIGQIMDITERKQAEIELKEKNDLLEKIFKNNIDLIALTDLEGNYIIAGESHQIMGYDIDYLIGKNVMDFVHPEDVSFVSSEFKTFLLSQKKHTVQYRNKRIDGEYLWFETAGTILKDTNGNPEQILFNTRDITDRKQAEEEIKRQLEEKEILLREVHHRIKNNVNSIESLLSMQARSTDNSEVILALQESISRVQSIRVLYDTLLIGKDYRDVSIRDYIESLIDSLVAVFPESKNVTIEKKITDFTLDSRKVIPVGIIINELLTNIFKYAFKGRDEGRILVALDKTENHVTLTIQDDGVGIDEVVDANKSPGFGLTIVRMLAQQLKGTCTIENNKGTKSILQFEI